MARSVLFHLSWKTIFIFCFITLCLLIYGNSFFVWRQTTIMITANPSDYRPHQQQVSNHARNDNHTDLTRVASEPPLQSLPLKESTPNYEEIQQNYNLYTNPYNMIAPSIYLKFVKQTDFLSFSDCLSSVTQANRGGKCALSKKIIFTFLDVIGSGNHGQILSANIEYTAPSNIPLTVDMDAVNSRRYALKYSSDNETCDVLQFEFNIMKQIQSA
eukprot:396049_1